MEDAATAEISRAQLWQWAHHAGRMTDGVTIDGPLVQATIPVVLDRIKQELGEQRFAASKFTAAGKLFDQMTAAEELPGFSRRLLMNRSIDSISCLHMMLDSFPDACCFTVTNARLCDVAAKPLVRVRR